MHGKYRPPPVQQAGQAVAPPTEGGLTWSGRWKLSFVHNQVAIPPGLFR